jgi:CubicO group peptidase (beta-lactamase class C family)
MRLGAWTVKRGKKKYLIGLVLIILIFVCVSLLKTQENSASIRKPAIAEVPPVSSTALKIDEYMKAYVDKGWFSGSILAAKNGEILISKGYGMANYELGVPNTPDTKFHLGSITKQFTAMAIMQLEEHGQLSVDDPLSKYIADYPNGNNITIHQLLTHTSGIMDYINDDNTFSYICRLYHPIEQVIGRFKNKPLEFKPGTRYEYSNSGYVLLSYIIEKVSGKKYKDFLADNIFKPLGMKNTGYDDTTPIIKNRASGYSIMSNTLTNADFFDRSNLQGADGLYSTVNDLYIWDRALYTEKIASKKTLERIFTPYPPADTYGYGWTVSPDETSHNGRMDGFYTCIYRKLPDKTAVIILSNLQQAPVKAICNDINCILEGKDYKLPEGLIQVNINQ